MAFPSHLQELRELNFLKRFYVSRIKFICFKISIFPAHVSGAAGARWGASRSRRPPRSTTELQQPSRRAAVCRRPNTSLASRRPLRRAPRH